jgi:hypothetical protein
MEVTVIWEGTDDKRRRASANRFAARQNERGEWQAGNGRDQDDLIFDTANICPKSINCNTSI